MISISQDIICKINDAVEKHETLEFSCYILTNNEKNRFTEILHVFLTACNQDHLFNCLSYCLLELLDNASKANAKRIYFLENDLDIENEQDYKQGIQSFKNDLDDHTSHYLQELANNFLKVNLQLSVNNVICIKVINNTKITDIEYKRITDKINKTKQYNNVGDAFGDIDQTEGSGLGIISIILMLKGLGLDTDHLSFKIDKDSTIATIEIPVDSFIEL